MRIPVGHRLNAFATTAVLMLASHVASAQPSGQPNAQSDPALASQSVVDRGEISDSQWIGGGLSSSVIGLGTGQAVQGRWAERGWMFALGEAATGATVVVGVLAGLACDEEDAACGSGKTAAIRVAVFGGLAGYVGFRVWDAIDAFVVPPRQNARVRALRAKLGLPTRPGIALAPFVAPVHAVRGDTAVTGFQLRF